MGSKSISIPDGLERKVEKRIEKGDYQNFSDFMRDAIRHKLDEDTELHPIEVRRLIEQGDDPETESLDKVKEELGIE